ncbi:VOC family protein [Sphingomonas jeddahensis]|uniref:Glyoxalase-like domain protein n=1 Tax=Sphingomonas jeddahensis TaxID=1915074 RepID=A0A1V2ESP8_9SPHN|nr:VOC family protein [Sphingomonas jeddahensis]ONF95563.1 Glyoxalase-like domain protein [Sphingomonas jeddahensis]
MPAPARLIVNLDVPDLARAEAFYCRPFGLRVGRRLGARYVELLGLEAPLYLLETADGSVASASSPSRRDYRRQRTPVHLDIAVDDLDASCHTAIVAGAMDETGIRAAPYGRIATFADPFGHGFCLIEFNERGYDAIAT